VIALVSGQLALKEGDRVVVRTASGLGYECFVPTRTLAQLPAPGQPVELYTSLVVREDGQTLYGFATVEERRVFQRLLQASGIGPKLALAMLSQHASDRLVRAIRERDIAALVAVPGVGKKTAERLVLELVDKTADLVAEEAAVASPASEVATKALVGLGYSAQAADDAVRRALAKDGRQNAADLIKAALALVAGA
jgi:Holliday junction DNA helicase RuvA